MKRMVSIDEQESPQGQKRRIMGNGGGGVIMHGERLHGETRKSAITGVLKAKLLPPEEHPL